jgi:hypothetical protein
VVHGTKYRGTSYQRPWYMVPLWYIVPGCRGTGCHALSQQQE